MIHFRIGALALLLLALPEAAGAAPDASGRPEPDPFYGSLLQSGEALYDQGRAAAAAKELRIACFGMLDRPTVLTRCLVRLGLAQADSGDLAGFHETFMRLLDVESHLPSYAGAEITPQIRGAFERQVGQRISAATLAGSPTFNGLVAAAKADDGKKKGRRAAAAPPATAPATPAPVTAPVTAPGTASVTAPVTTAPIAAETKTPPAQAPPALTSPLSRPHDDALSAADHAILATAREALKAAKTVNELQTAAVSAQRLSDAHLGAAEAAALAGEIAYRSSAWPTAVTYLRRSGPPADQPLLGFYLAVSLYEIGDRESAKSVLRPLLARLQRTPYVESYIAKILPPGPGR